MPMDFETETFCVEVAHTLRGEGMDASEDGTGRGIPIVPVRVLLQGRWSGRDGRCRANDACDGPPGDRIRMPAASSRSRSGDLDRTDSSPSEIAPPVLASDGGSVGPPLVFESRFARNGRGAPDIVAPPLKAQSGGSGRGDGAPLLVTWIAVRRLTARECERLQGLPDDYTLIPNYRQGFVRMRSLKWPPTSASRSRKHGAWA